MPRRLVLEAREGGSITPEAAAELRQAQRRGELQLHEHCEVQAARWGSDQWDIVCFAAAAQWLLSKNAELVQRLA